MWTHFCNLLWQSFLYTPTIISSNWVGALFPLVTYLIGETIRFSGGGWVAVTRAWKKDTLLMTGAYFAGYILLFTWAVVHIVYEDHETLMKRIAGLTAKPADLIYNLDDFFDGRIDSHYFVLFAVTVENRYGPPRSINKWGAAVDTPSGRVDGLTYTPHTRQLPINEHHTMTLEPTAWCPAATESPIPTGGTRACWMMLIFDGDPNTLEKAVTSVTISFRDVLSGKTLELNYPMSRSGIPSILQH
jgi:hypothetical protein